MSDVPRTRSRGSGTAGKGLKSDRIIFRPARRSLRMRFKNGRSLSHYVFLMFSENNGKNNTCIGLSRNPINKVYHYNQGNLRHRRGGKSSSGKWYLQLIVGPFDTVTESEKFRVHWTRNSRSLGGRSKKGRELAIHNKLACWDMHHGIP